MTIIDPSYIIPSYITADTAAITTSYSDSAVVIDGNNNKVSINARLVVQNRDIMKELDEMRDALLLLRRDVDMESRYPRLRELKDAYEQEMEKYRTFERLK
mgnify:CR=1 FL=1